VSHRVVPLLEGDLLQDVPSADELELELRGYGLRDRGLPYRRAPAEYYRLHVLRNPRGGHIVWDVPSSLVISVEKERDERKYHQIRTILPLAATMNGMGIG